MMPLPDLLKRFKEGDQYAFECLYLDYSPKVYHFARRYITNKEDTEEVVQDVFLRLWGARMSINPDLNFDNYLFTITRNLIFNQYRSKVNEQHFQIIVLSSMEQGYEMTEEKIIIQDLLEYIDSIIKKFPPKQQEVFYLSRKQMLTHKEIAEKLCISEKTVKAHIYQVLNKIRSYLKNDDVNFILFFIF